VPAARALRFRPCRKATFPDLAAGEMTPQLQLVLPPTSSASSTRPSSRSSTEEDALLPSTAIYLHTAGTAKSQVLRAVATTCHRLAQVELARWPAGAGGMPGIIVPRKTVGEVQRLIEDSEAEVTIELSQGKIRFTLGDVVLTSKLIDGTFSRLCARHPARQRQGAGRRQEGVRAGGRPASPRSRSEARPRRQAPRLSNGTLMLSVTNSGFGQRHRRRYEEVEYAARPARYRLQLALTLPRHSPPRSKARRP